MRYVVEVRTAAGAWLPRGAPRRLLADARAAAALAQERGAEARVVRVAGDGARTVVA